LTPHLPAGQTEIEQNNLLRLLLDDFLAGLGNKSFVAWYYTPMALKYSGHLQPMTTIYDCMDELSAFKFAPPELADLEKDLFQKADIVFTGGRSLYELKKGLHENVHLFPSSIDIEHFGAAATTFLVAKDQVDIPSPILGFFGVIDERFDIDLIREVALKRPAWQIVLIGPVIKIDPATLPRFPNIHYLGSKNYNDLPKYLSSWDIALIPFLLNESTRFISPTKTPEYLAAGIPVLSTAIADVMDPYGVNGLVDIVNDSEDLIVAAEIILSDKPSFEWKEKIQHFLSKNSWDKTVSAMIKEIENIKTTTT
jgi:UDP-galactopyranose mutase